jgi:hypothetical protein
MMDHISVKDADFSTLAQEILKHGNSIRFRAHGSSMLPLIRDGDLLTVQPVDWVELKVGQVIFYQTAGKKCIAHRLIKIEVRDQMRLLTTRGDSSPASEEQISEDQALGQVVEIHRGDKRINLGRNLWWILSRYLTGFLSFIYLIVRIQRKIGRDPTFSQGNSGRHSQGE